MDTPFRPRRRMTLPPASTWAEGGTRIRRFMSNRAGTGETSPGPSPPGRRGDRAGEASGSSHACPQRRQSAPYDGGDVVRTTGVGRWSPVIARTREPVVRVARSEEHTSELQSREKLVLWHQPEP